MPSYAMQTTYARDFAKGLPGQIANEEKYNGISRSVETTAGLAFGAPAARGTNDHGCILFASGGAFLGIAVATHSPEHRQPGGTAITDGYPARATASLMTEGQMYVLADAAVAQGGAVYWNPATGRYSTVTTGGNLAIPNARFDTTATAAGQIVEISVGNHRAA
jgi:hypothetical protein